MNQDNVNNEGILTVSALTQYLKCKFDVDPYLQHVVLVGEISNFNPKATKHRYFSLKDEGAKIAATMFKSAYDKLRFQPQEGMKVIVEGRISLYPAGGSYQVIIERMQPDGIGALYQAFEQLKAKLSQEGLFNLPKKALAKYPNRIAVVTSPSGAVIRDILTTIQRRYPLVEVVVFPTKVQGTEAADEVVAAFRQIESQARDFDTVIVARGGGSIEDLWTFNEEVVARAIVACTIPVISSIGHETDTTIADYVADMRAPTPTAAAELAVPHLRELSQQLKQNDIRLANAIQNRLGLYRKQLHRYQESYTLKDPQRLYQPYVQRVDELTLQLVNTMLRFIREHRITYAHNLERLEGHSPGQAISLYRKQVDSLQDRLIDVKDRYFANKQKDFQAQVQVLDALSPLKILSRGFAIVEKDRQLVSHINQVASGDTLAIRLQDGQVHSSVIRVTEEV